MRRCDPDTLDLLWQFVHTDQPDTYRPHDPSTYVVGDRLLTPDEVERLRRSTQADFDALDTLLAAEGALLGARRDDLLQRAARAGIDLGPFPDLL